MNSLGHNPDALSDPPEKRLVRFGVFEFELTSGKLTRNGLEVSLNQQQGLVLSLLLQRAGKLVTREELQEAIWPSGTYVEFDLGLNTAMSRLRRALGDSAAEPRYVETVPKQGYRFIAPVEHVLPVRPLEPARPAAPAEPPAHNLAAPPARSPYRNIAIGLAAVVLLLSGGAWWFLRAPARDPRSVLKYTIYLPPGQQVDSLQISPAGEQIVYASQGHIYRRFLDEDEPRAVVNSDGGEQPFFSPDGREVGFYAPGALRVTAGGTTRDAAPVPAGFYLRKAVWADDGYIYFTSRATAPSPAGPAEGIWRVPATGGKPENVLMSRRSDRGATVYFGQQLLSGERLLYSTNTSPRQRSIEWLTVGKPPASRIVEQGMGGRILETGHLLYFWHGRLLASPFDENQMRLKGSPVEMISGVASDGWRGPRAAVSKTGTLVYVKQPFPQRQLIWVERDGKESKIDVPDAAYEQAVLSPQGDRVSIVRQDESDKWSLSILDLRTKAFTRIADCDVPTIRAVWSPDGKQLIASLAKDGSDFVNLYRIPLAAPDKTERLTSQPDFGQFPMAWSAAANAILFLEGTHPGTQADILMLPLDGDRRPRTLVATPGPDLSPTVSPDGRWFVYASHAQDRHEVFIQDLQQTSPPRKLDVNGASYPQFSADGKRLYLLGANGAIVEARISGNGEWSEPPKEITPPTGAVIPDWWSRGFSATPGGRFLIIRNVKVDLPPRSQIHVVVNWFEELKRAAP